MRERPNLRSARWAAVLLLAALGGAGVASAGTVSLAWDPVTHPNLAGYKVYFGTSSNNYPQSVETGLGTSVTLNGLNDCTTYYIAVKARATDLSESPVFSNEISGWARPVVTSVSPGNLEQGTTLDVTIGGTNFQNGLAVDFADPAITVNNVSVGSCGQITANVTVGAAASLGPGDLDVVNPDTVFGTGSGLFNVISDTSGPAISSVQAQGVGSTSATIAWTTDEPADSQVFFRVQGTTTYQSTAIDPSLVTSHSVGLTGLMPSTDYEFYVRSADSGANASTSTPVQTFSTSANGFTYLRIEAEDGALDSSHDVTSGSGAFEGAWVELAAGSPGGTPSNPSGTSTYDFHVAGGGTWYVWVRLYGPAANADSWFESVDGAGFQPVVASSTGSWEWVAGRSYTLSSGLHTLTLGGREALSRVDRVLITDDAGFVPSEVPGADTNDPNPVSGLSATPGDTLNALTWTNPTNGDLDRIVVRYRTDGQFPLSPVDGLPLADGPAAPGAAGSFNHTGLTNGTTYSYSVFAVDGSGNVSNAATVAATPQAPPLGQVPNLRRTDTQ